MTCETALLHVYAAENIAVDAGQTEQAEVVERVSE
jgi:hypothetical protein